MWCAVDNHNNICHIISNYISDLKFNQAVNDNACISILTKFPQISHTTKILISKRIIRKKNRPTAILQILWQEHVKKKPFHCMFPSYEPLKH